jgi:hypothetical protein
MKKLAEMIEEGCTCGEAGTCRYCKAQEHLVKKLAFYKRAGAPGMDPAVAETAVPPGGQDPSMMAGQMPPPPPPDCQCGGQGQCLPCKKAQLARVMMQANAGGGQGQPGGNSQATTTPTSPEQMM